MNIDKGIISQAIVALSSIDRIRMDPEALAEDAAYLTLAFPEQSEYKTAIANTVKALRDLAHDRVSTSMLDGVYQDWESYHYQPKRGQSIEATMRILFKRESNSIHVLAFGHRYVPTDLYRRVSSLRNTMRNPRE